MPRTLPFAGRSTKWDTHHNISSLPSIQTIPPSWDIFGCLCPFGFRPCTDSLSFLQVPGHAGRTYLQLTLLAVARSPKVISHTARSPWLGFAGPQKVMPFSVIWMPGFSNLDVVIQQFGYPDWLLILLVKLLLQCPFSFSPPNNVGESQHTIGVCSASIEERFHMCLAILSAGVKSVLDSLHIWQHNCHKFGDWGVFIGSEGKHCNSRNMCLASEESSIAL